MMQEIKNEDISFSKLKTKFKILLESLREKCVVNSKSQNGCVCFIIVIRGLRRRKKVYLGVWDLVQNERQLSSDLCHKKKYESSQKIKWFESKSKNQEKLLQWFESSFLWFE